MASEEGSAPSSDGGGGELMIAVIIGLLFCDHIILLDGRLVDGFFAKDSIKKKARASQYVLSDIYVHAHWALFIPSCARLCPRTTWGQQL